MKSEKWKCIFWKCILQKCIFGKCTFPKCIFQKCIYPRCVLAKCTRLVSLLGFASLFGSRQHQQEEELHILGVSMFYLYSLPMSFQIYAYLARWGVSKYNKNPRHCGLHGMSIAQGWMPDWPNLISQKKLRRGKNSFDRICNSTQNKILCTPLWLSEIYHINADLMNQQMHFVSSNWCTG